MRRLLLICGASLLALTAVYLLRYTKEACHLCRTCGSCRYTDEVGLGDPDRWHVAIFKSDRISDSHARNDLCAPDHEHDWRGLFGNRSFLMGGVHWDGHPRRNRFVIDYQDDPKFRRFIAAKIEAGVLDREAASELLTVERPPDRGPGCPSQAPPPQPPPIEPEHARLLALGNQLFAEFYEGDAEEEWWFWW